MGKGRKFIERGKFNSSIIPLVTGESYPVTADDQVWSADSDGAKGWINNGISTNFSTLEWSTDQQIIDYSHNGKILVSTYTGNLSTAIMLDNIPEGAMEVAIRFRVDSGGSGSSGWILGNFTTSGFPELGNFNGYYINTNFLPGSNMIHCFTPDGLNWYLTGEMEVA